MKIVDTGPCYDLALAFTAISLRGLYCWAASCTLIPEPHRPCVPKEGVTEHSKLVSKTWKTERITKRFLPSCFHSSPCTCWKEHVLGARRELEAASSGCMFITGTSLGISHPVWFARASFPFLFSYSQRSALFIYRV